VKPTFVSLIFLLSASSWAFAQPQLENVIVSHTSDEFVSELVFDQPVKDDQVSVEFINKTIQVDIPGLKIPEGKRLNRVNHSKVKSVFTYQASNRTLRTRIIYKPSEQNAERYEGFVQVAADGNRLKISVTDPEIGMSTQLPEKEIPVIPPTDLEKGHEAIQLKSSKELSPEEIVASTSIGKYTVQVASYPDETEAKKHASSLEGKGFSAFYIPAKVKGNTWYRVSVGLFNNQSTANSFRKDLMKQADIKSAIVTKIVK
jgi:cell division septation protein DedD